MSVSRLLILAGFCALNMDGAPNQVIAQEAYPRVVGPTGRFYGPTQAHYQYERQYGRPWYGGAAPFDPNTGANITHPNINIQVPVHGGFGYAGVGFGGFYPGYVPYAGYGYQNYGFPIVGGVPFLGNGPVINGFNGYGYDALYQNQLNYGGMQQFYQGPQFQFSWQQQLQQQLQAGTFPRNTPQPPLPGGQQFGGQQFGGQQFNGLAQGRRPDLVPAPAPQGHVVGVRPVGPEEPVLTKARRLIPPQPSTFEQKARSVHFQGQGDIWFRQQNYLQAYSRYKQAASAAADQAAPRFRMAYALIALKRYELAVTEMVRGIQLDPNYPMTGESPAQVLGPDNQIAANALPGQVADWVRQDMRSPDRLFLLGALLRMNGDIERAQVCFEAAAQLGDRPEAVMAFMRAGQPNGNAKSGRPQIAADDDRPPVPEAVEELLNSQRNMQSGQPSNKAVAGVNPSSSNRGDGRSISRSSGAVVGGQKLMGPPPVFPRATGSDAPAFVPNRSDEDESDIPPVPTIGRSRNTTRQGGPQAGPGVARENSFRESSSGASEEDANEKPVVKTPAKPKSDVPGFQPIPKKGSGTQPDVPSSEEGDDVSTESPPANGKPAGSGSSEKGAGDSPESEASPKSGEEPKGPVIPNPQPGS